ncbi:MAG: hypothetical protein P1V97_16580, partial [Planctomycetota bacterium]|nr:hypothetical protein [Planctomycetota bacterium]
MAKLSLLVLKTKQMLELKEFYERLGLQFVEEKHGRGPLHFAATLGSLVLEIYPLSDEESTDVSLR